MTAESVLKNVFKEECKAGTFLTPEDEAKVYMAMVEFAQYHCNQQLYEILNTIELITDKDVTTEGLVVKVTVDTKSIINAYPTYKIK